MAQSQDHQRREIHYSGQVQGVGFRYTTQRIADQFEVSGYVKNLRDGRVQVVLEGCKPEIEAFLLRLQEEMGRHIRDRQVEIVTPTGEFDGFEVRY